MSLRGLLSSAEVALLRQGIEHNLAAPSARAIIASRADDRGRFVEDFCTGQDTSAYRRVIFESPLAAAAARLMRSTTARLHHDHMLALHAAGPVDADRRRRVFSLRFLGDDIRHAPRRWKTSPDFADLADTLPAGAAMEHPLFPIVWPRQP